MPRFRILPRAVAVAALTIMVFAAGRAGAEPYPAANKITVVVAFAPGGIADTLARLIAQGLSERLHQSVIVENRGGAGGNIAAASVARAEPDGYTLLATTTALAINETLFADKPFAAGDFKTVAIAASSPEALVTSPSNPSSNLAEFIKAMDGKTINLAIPGVGTGSDIEAEYFFKILAKAWVQPIPFQGGAPAINATIGNQVDLMATTLGGGAAAQIAGGKLKGLGIAADKRAAVAPNVPTYAEQGFPGFTAASWVGFFAPAKTDPQIVATLNAAISDILKTADVATKLADMGFEPIAGTPAQADAMFAAEIKKWGDMVKALGLSIK
jgi:tripartite-type tricarboxylate transporter receptor subunit TctC